MDCDHRFNWDATEVVAMANTKQAQEFLEAWYSNTNSINRRVDLEAHYEAEDDDGGSDDDDDDDEEEDEDDDEEEDEDDDEEDDDNGSGGDDDDGDDGEGNDDDDLMVMMTILLTHLWLHIGISAFHIGIYGTICCVNETELQKLNMFIFM
ncbi:unnamed protein product [Schistocephalus solidus]|uniref:Uncharacterized protein n=1 Tax=Schistocephalus solidus TaxID=70667 RepID=A0A183TM79_SCHSO|nr:unnamed protein product [Schistocephalus solidus]